MSRDPAGDSLGGSLLEAGVRLDCVAWTDDPTTHPLAEIDEDGTARYRFDVDGTSVPGLQPDEARAAMPERPAALHIGGLGLVFEPQASAISLLVTEADDATLVMIDPNWRPEAIRDPTEYRRPWAAVLRRADVVKLSDDDLEHLHPGRARSAGARRLLASGPKVVPLTPGARGASVITKHGEFTIHAPERRWSIRSAPAMRSVAAG